MTRVAASYLVWLHAKSGLFLQGPVCSSPLTTTVCRSGWRCCLAPAHLCRRSWCCARRSFGRASTCACCRIDSGKTCVYPAAGHHPDSARHAACASALLRCGGALGHAGTTFSSAGRVCSECAEIRVRVGYGRRGARHNANTHSVNEC